MATEPFPNSPTEFARSDLFQRTYAEGMGLVEETAEFLEGPGRDISKELSRDGALAYANYSMRLTTRLMHIASWLLVQRAVRDGDMTAEEARAERYRLMDDDVDEDDMDGAVDELPGELIELTGRCDSLFSRLLRLDERLNNRAQRRSTEPNPVARQIADLHAALVARDRH